MKKTFFAIFAIAALIMGGLLTGCSMNTLSEPSLEMSFDAHQTGSMVSLVNAYTTSQYIYHGAAAWTRTFRVRVKNVAYNKYVAISHEQADGSWQDISLSYSESLPDGYELWEGEISYSGYGGPFPSLGDEFVVKYTVNGATYWYNNNGQNYAADMSSLGADFKVIMESNETSYFYGPNFYQSKGAIILKNLGYSKSVNIVYTTDNWATTEVAACSYRSGPDGSNNEIWGYFIEMGDDSSIEFVISYDVAGVTYWDNNFGRNYTFSAE